MLLEVIDNCVLNDSNHSVRWCNDPSMYSRNPSAELTHTERDGQWGPIVDDDNDRAALSIDLLEQATDYEILKCE